MMVTGLIFCLSTISGQYRSRRLDYNADGRSPFSTWRCRNDVCSMSGCGILALSGHLELEPVGKDARDVCMIWLRWNMLVWVY